MSSSTKFRFSLFFALSIPFLSTRLWYDFRKCGILKTAFFGYADQMAANFRKLGIQKSTMIHDIFNCKPEQQPSLRKPCRRWKQSIDENFTKTAGIHYHKRKKS